MAVAARGYRESMAMLLARIRMPLVYVALLWLVLGPLLGVPWWIPLALLLVALAVYLRIGTVRREPITVAPPVEGRWRALNSPADRVPSHGLHAYGQTYAIDMLYAEQDDAEHIDWWPFTRPPEAFSGFGDGSPTTGVPGRAKPFDSTGPS
jgi:hypothetical protein